MKCAILLNWRLNTASALVMHISVTEGGGSLLGTELRLCTEIKLSIEAGTGNLFLNRIILSKKCKPPAAVGVPANSALKKKNQNSD